MGNIRLLPDVVASQVAAGEVVERPASVVKELIENSLDAEARNIEIEVARGGMSLIRVTDDGSGMDRDDALLCLERHATSKIRAGADLSHVRTFGFRGEALPSIASVSRFRLATRTAGAEAGTEILIEGGKVREVRECGETPGTTIEARALFYNLPARKKFLRTELTESAHILHCFQATTLAHPEIQFALIKDGKKTHQLPAAMELKVRVLDLLGEAWCENLMEMEPHAENGIRVLGLVSRPSFTRMDRTGQFVFLNRRPVQDLAVSRGLREAFAGLGDGRAHPVGVIFLEMDPGAFDCNVHPAKREVRFLRPDLVREAVCNFAKQALRTCISVPAVFPHAAHVPSDDSKDDSRKLMPALEPKSFRPAIPQLAPETRPLDLPGKEVPANADPVCPAPEITFPAPPVETFSFRGTLGERYLLLEICDGLVVVDRKHAAERIFYEDAVRKRTVRQVPSQQLLSAVAVQLSPKEFAWVSEHFQDLATAGLVLEPFGMDTVKIEAIPAGLEEWSPQNLLLRLIDEVRNGTPASAGRFWQDQVALALARIHASRLRGTEENPLQLVERLMACELPYASPSGHPTLIQIGWNELARKFGK